MSRGARQSLALSALIASRKRSARLPAWVRVFRFMTKHIAVRDVTARGSQEGGE